jgi:hypothetical protein
MAKKTKMKGGAGAWWNPFGLQSNSNSATQNANDKIDVAKNSAKKLVENISDIKIALDQISIAQNADSAKVDEEAKVGEEAKESSPSIISSLIPKPQPVSMLGNGKRKTVKGGKKRKSNSKSRKRR